ncbi:MAG: trypsin-like serine protease [Bacteriovoracaceae bacterium]|nr:trypsin-like serine protease [Bacteriovoracaceae bacterium]
MLKGLFLIYLFSFSLQSEAGTSKTVFEDDKRDQIFQTGTRPYLRIGQVGSHCSGFLISESHVLTAASCVYDAKNKKWIQNLNFIPGRDGGSNPFGMKEWEAVHIHQSYMKNKSDDWNLAVIKLKKPVGRRNGYFNMPSSESYLGPIEIAGYPLDKPANSMWSSQCFANTKSQRLVYKCDTFQGLTGAPIISESGDGLLAVGIHTSEGFQENYGVYLTNLRRFFIRRWISGNEPTGTLTWYKNNVGTFYKHHSVSLKNECNTGLSFKVKFSSTDGTLKVIDTNLSTRFEKYHFNSINSKYYIKVENGNWVEMEIKDEDWGSVDHILPCQYPYDTWYARPISPL